MMNIYDYEATAGSSLMSFSKTIKLQLVALRIMKFFFVPHEMLVE